MAFKKFTQVNQRFESRITVTPTSAFGFPAQFFKNENLDQFKYAVLYFDQERMAVGLHFTNSEEEQHKFSLLKSKQGYGGQITARSFFRSYNLDPRIYSGKYDWEIDESDAEVGKLYVIILKEKVSVNKPEDVLTETQHLDTTLISSPQEEATASILPPSSDLETSTTEAQGGVS